MKFRNFLVQETVVQNINHFPVHDFLELLQVHHEPGALVNLAFHRYLQGLIVAVAVRVIAFAENALVFFRRELRIVVKVRGGKLRLSCQIDHVCQLFSSRFPFGIDELAALFDADSAADWGYSLPFHVTAPRTLEWNQDRSRSHAKSGKPKKEIRLAVAGKWARRMRSKKSA